MSFSIKPNVADEATTATETLACANKCPGDCAIAHIRRRVLNHSITRRKPDCLFRGQGQRMREACEHLLRHHLPEGEALALPFGKNALGMAGACLARMLLDQAAANPLPMGPGEPLRDNAVRIDAKGQT